MHDGLRKRTISGDVSDLKGLRTHSGEITRIQLTSTAWVPWQPVSDEWNAGSAMNLCLLSDLAYEYEEVSSRDESGSGSGRLWEDGEADVRAADQPLSYFFASLKGKTDRTQELVSSDIAPGGELPLMTRSVPEGEHFQDLRFWDSNQIGADRDIPPTYKELFTAPWYLCIWYMSNSWYVYAGVFVIGLILFAGCSNASKGPEQASGPVVIVKGKKPPSFGLKLGFGFTSTSLDENCKYLSARNMGYHPIQRSKQVWSLRPPEDQLRPTPERTVDVQRERQESAGERGSFRWIVNAEWDGEPKGCSMKIDTISLSVFAAKSAENVLPFQNLGGFSLKANPVNQSDWEHRNRPVWNGGPLDIICSFERDLVEYTGGVSCEPGPGFHDIYRAPSSIPDTVQMTVKIEKSLR